jgi:hypothetical protein
MVAGLSDHKWSMADILPYPLFPSNQQPGNVQHGRGDAERLEGR